MFHAHRHETSGRVVADRLALCADADLLEDEQLLVPHLTLLDAGDPGDADDTPHAPAKPGLLDDQVNARAYGLADGARWKVLARLQHQRLETNEAFVRVVCVDRRHGAIVAGVHGLEHVQRLAATTLTDDEPVGAHSKTALDELSDGDSAFAFHVGWTRFELDPVRLLQLKLSRVLTRDESFGFGDERRKNIEQRRLT